MMVAIALPLVSQIFIIFCRVVLEICDSSFLELSTVVLLHFSFVELIYPPFIKRASLNKKRIDYPSISLIFDFCSVSTCLNVKIDQS